MADAHWRPKSSRGSTASHTSDSSATGPGAVSDMPMPTTPTLDPSRTSVFDEFKRWLELRTENVEKNVAERQAWEPDLSPPKMLTRRKRGQYEKMRRKRGQDDDDVDEDDDPELRLKKMLAKKLERLPPNESAAGHQGPLHHVGRSSDERYPPTTPSGSQPFLRRERKASLTPQAPPPPHLLRSHGSSRLDALGQHATDGGSSSGPRIFAMPDSSHHTPPGPPPARSWRQSSTLAASYSNKPFEPTSSRLSAPSYQAAASVSALAPAPAPLASYKAPNLHAPVQTSGRSNGFLAPPPAQGGTSFSRSYTQMDVDPPSLSHMSVDPASSAPERGPNNDEMGSWPSSEDQPRDQSVAPTQSVGQQDQDLTFQPGPGVHSAARAQHEIGNVSTPRAQPKPRRNKFRHRPDQLNSARSMTVPSLTVPQADRRSLSQAVQEPNDGPSGTSDSGPRASSPVPSTRSNPSTSDPRPGLAAQAMMNGWGPEHESTMNGEEDTVEIGLRMRAPSTNTLNRPSPLGLAERLHTIENGSSHHQPAHPIPSPLVPPSTPGDTSAAFRSARDDPNQMVVPDTPAAPHPKQSDPAPTRTPARVRWTDEVLDARTPGKVSNWPTGAAVNTPHPPGFFKFDGGSTPAPQLRTVSGPAALGTQPESQPLSSTRVLPRPGEESSYSLDIPPNRSLNSSLDSPSRPRGTSTFILPRRMPVGTPVPATSPALKGLAADEGGPHHPEPVPDLPPRTPTRPGTVEAPGSVVPTPAPPGRWKFSPKSTPHPLVAPAPVPLRTVPNSDLDPAPRESTPPLTPPSALLGSHSLSQNDGHASAGSPSTLDQAQSSFPSQSLDVTYDTVDEPESAPTATPLVKSEFPPRLSVDTPFGLHMQRLEDAVAMFDKVPSTRRTDADSDQQEKMGAQAATTDIPIQLENQVKRLDDQVEPDQVTEFDANVERAKNKLQLTAQDAQAWNERKHRFTNYWLHSSSGGPVGRGLETLSLESVRWISPITLLAGFLFLWVMLIISSYLAAEWTLQKYSQDLALLTPGPSIFSYEIPQVPQSPGKLWSWIQGLLLRSPFSMAHKTGVWSPELDELLAQICYAQSSLGLVAVLKLGLYALRALCQAHWFAAKVFFQAGVTNMLEGVSVWWLSDANRAFPGTAGTVVEVIPGYMFCPVDVRAG